MIDNTVKVLDLQRFVLAAGLVCAFAACMTFLLIRAVPEANKDIVVYMAGQLSGMATLALAYYFTKNAGQDAQDAKKTENTGKMADAIVAAASSSAPADARQAAEQVAGAAEDEARKIAGDDSTGQPRS